MNKIIFKIFLSIFLIGNLTSLKAQCLPGYNIFSQADIDNFSINYPGCIEITGDVVLLPNIFNLHGFSQLESIGGVLRIYNTQIENLEGLENLNSVNVIDINNNQDLQNIQSLANLTSVNDLSIGGSPHLSSLSSLENITTIQFGLSISGDSLTSLDGLQNITSTGHGVTISHTPIIENLHGLEGLISVGGSLRVSENNSMKNLEGLENLTTVGSDIFISLNPQLSTYSNLENLTSVGEDFIIQGLILVENLDGLENLTHVGGRLSITGNEILNNIDGVKNIDATNMTDLWIQLNPLLSECAIQSVCDFLSINPANTNIVLNASGCEDRQEVEAACALSTEENQLAELKIYPNPTNGYFEISGLNEGNIQVMDSQGRTVKYCKIGDELSLNGVSQGVYFLKITSENKSVTKQLVRI